MQSQVMRTADPKLDAFRAIMVAQARLTRALGEQLREEVDLDLRSYDALLHIYEAGDGGTRMADLADQLALSRSGLTTLVDRLEKAGLMSRKPDGSDRRSIRVVLTDRGHEVFRRAARVHVQGIATLFGDRIDAKEARVLVDVLTRFS